MNALAKPHPAIAVEKYPASLRVLHWTMFLAFVVLFVTGPIMVDLDREDPNRLLWFTTHKSAGVVALSLAIARLIVRLRAILPAAPPTFAAWELTLASLTHRLLYLGLLAIPLSGWFASDVRGRPIKLFGLIQLPQVFPTIQDVGTWPGLLHTVLAYTLLGLIGVHVIAAIKHIRFDRYPLLQRIL